MNSWSSNSLRLTVTLNQTYTLKFKLVCNVRLLGKSIVCCCYSGACWSPVGRSGDGVQRLSLGQRCWYLGIVVHELGHAIGFWHEMNRPDRDDWIYVYWNNIIRVGRLLNTNLSTTLVHVLLVVNSLHLRKKVVCHTIEKKIITIVKQLIGLDHILDLVALANIV